MRRPDRCIAIGHRLVGEGQPCYFIADIAANHDGSLGRAVELIRLAAASGADAAKFQHFEAATIVSDRGFRSLGEQKSHQAAWKKSVYDVYREAEVGRDWTTVLEQTCLEEKIAFFTSPYSKEIVDLLDDHVPAYKIGSGDITWGEMIRYIAGKQKPYILSTGASEIGEVQRAVDAGLSINPAIALLQCNTNYTAKRENLCHINLNVLRTYRALYPEMILGLSDHTGGYTTVLGAVALGAKIVEKHFTDDPERKGPDHPFSMAPRPWQEMVQRVRDLERSMGDGIKRVEDNERETVVLQRRALRASADLAAGTLLTTEHLAPLRPCPVGAIEPNDLDRIIGRKIRHDLEKGSHLEWTDIE